jgi:hypothetical protein
MAVHIVMHTSIRARFLFFYNPYASLLSKLGMWKGQRTEGMLYQGKAKTQSKAVTNVCQHCQVGFEPMAHCFRRQLSYSYLGISLAGAG